MNHRAESDLTAAEPDSVPLRGLLWLLIAVYIVSMARWGFHAGMQIRDDAWKTTRTIRFEGDIRNAISRWGTMTVQTAQDWANFNAARQRKPGDPVLSYVVSPRPDHPEERELGFWDLVHGVDQVYQNMVNGQSDEGDYGLDYPPLRLLTMTLWTRHEMKEIPGFQGWPNRGGPSDWEPLYSATGNPADLVTEDIATPMLLVNSYAIAGASVLGFFLVWIWVNRGGRPALATPRTGWTAWFAPRKMLVPWKPVPLRRVNGLLLFAVAAWAFFYAVIIAENPVYAPPPIVQFSGRPILTPGSNGTVSAIITAAIDGQGSDAQWHIDWGLSDQHYDHHTPNSGVGGDEVSAPLNDLPAATTIHYRVTASNDRGITRTDDASFNTASTLADMPPRDRFGAVWLSWEQWVGIAVLFLAMVAGLWVLPTPHRAWASALVAGLLMWLDPSVIVNSHIWPQWDSWVLPPFLLAALLGTLDWWFTAGLVLGVGMMFKGQTMIAGSLLMLWPLMSGNWRALIRMGIGYVLAAGTVLSPWLLLNNQPANWDVGPLRWVFALMAATLVSATISLYRGPLWRRAVDVWRELNGEIPENQLPPEDLASTVPLTVATETPPVMGAAPSTFTMTSPPIPRPQTSLYDLIFFCAALLVGIILMVVLVLKRWPTDLDVPRSYIGLFLFLAILVPPWFLPRKTMGVWVCAILASSIWMGAYLYHGDWAWKSVGFEYGTRKFTRMALGIGSNGNVPQILETRWGFDVHDTVLTLHPPDIAGPLHLAVRAADGTMTGWVHDWGLDGTELTIDIITFLKIAFFSLVAMAAVGLAIQSRRNNPRALAAFAAVWVLMSNVLCQMAGRYHMFGAAMTSLLIGISPGLTLLHFILALLAAGIIAAQLLGSDPSRSPMMHDLFTKFGPDDGWIMLTIGLVILYVAIAPGKSPPADELAKL